MLYRRIIASACALCLVVPAAAVARAGFDPPSAQRGPVAYGDTKYDLQNVHDLAGDTKGDLSVTQQYERAIAGDTKGDLPRSIAPAPDAKPAYVDRVGSLTAPQLAAAYGTTKPAAPPHASIVADDHGTDGWRIAAVIEAALLAILAIVAVVLVSRRRTSRVGV